MGLAMAIGHWPFALGILGILDISAARTLVWAPWRAPGLAPPHSSPSGPAHISRRASVRGPSGSSALALESTDAHILHILHILRVLRNLRVRTQQCRPRGKW